MRESGLDGLDIGRKSNIKKTIKESMKKYKTFKLGNHIFHQKKNDEIEEDDINEEEDKFSNMLMKEFLKEKEKKKEENKKANK